MTGPWDERASIAEAAYLGDPDRGTGEPRLFAEWAIGRVKKFAGVRDVVELGCGPGRDSGRLALEGFRVQGVDFSPTAIERALAWQRSLREPYRSRLSFVHGEALQFLEGRPPASADVVLANVVYGTWTDPEIERLSGLLYRLLRPGGFHLFAVRHASDPNAGKGSRVGPHTYLGGPHDVAYRYYTVDELEDRMGPKFERLETLFTKESHLLFALDRRRKVGGAVSESAPQGGG